MKYVIGIDYGTLSARTVLVSIETNEIISTTVRFYPNGVMEHFLTPDIPLEDGWAIQNGNDYYFLLIDGINTVIKDSGIDPKNIIGIGIDTTACSMLPLGTDLEPLSNNPMFKNNPNAYLKLWKHHAAQKYADKLNEIARELREGFLKTYGGKISSEWMFPKIMQIADESPDVYDSTYCFTEVADWVVYKLTGNLLKSNTMAGFKAIWDEDTGFPDTSFFKALNPKMENVIKEKFFHPIVNIGMRAGYVVEEIQQLTGLGSHTAVAVAHTDAGIVPFAIGMSKVGQMVMSIGTSTCHFLLSDKLKEVPGICGVVKDGSLPGFYTYEAGQTAVGDIFDWFVKSFVNEKMEQEAKQKDISVFQLLGERAELLQVGENGLIMLDWLNGNRSILVDSDLSGVLIGLTLHTKPEEVYRALLESTAYGTKIIIETLEDHGITVDEIYACGGIPKKDPFMMQIYADVLNKCVRVPDEGLAAAFGCAVHAASVAEKKYGGFESVSEAISEMSCKKELLYLPISENNKKYEKLYKIYKSLHNYFGKEVDLLKILQKEKLILN